MTKNTAESLLEIGLVFTDAKKNLNETEYELFIQETSYEKATSTVRKWNCIGNAYIRLKPITHLLPPTLSVIYTISTLNAQELDQLVIEKKLCPSSTLKDINDALRKISANSRILFKATLEFSTPVDPYQIRTLLDEIAIHHSEIVKIKLSSELDEILMNINQQNKKIA